MKKLTTAAILVGGAIMASQSVYATYSPNDLYFGLTNPNGTADYIYNLGASSGIVAYGAVTDFGIAGFSSGLLGTDSSKIAGGVVGGSQYIPNVYYTVMRSSLGDRNVAGSTTPEPPRN